MYAYSCCNLYIFAAIRMSEVSARFELARVRGVIGSRLYLLCTFFYLSSRVILLKEINDALY